MYKKVNLILAILLMTASLVDAQRKNAIGISVIGENFGSTSKELKLGKTFRTDPIWTISYGVNYERVISKTLSIYAGFRFRKVQTMATEPTIGFDLYYSINEKYLSVPILFKYNLRSFVLAAGFNIDFFQSWEDNKKTLAFGNTLKSYDVYMDDKIQAGVLLAMGKTIKLGRRYILEPSVFYNKQLVVDRTLFGATVDLKYTF